MVNHGVPCCFGARNIITTAMMNYCNVWCLKSLVPLGSGMKNDVLDQQKPIQRFKHFYSGVPLGLSAKTKTNHDIFDLVISVCHWGNPVARTFARTHFATVCHAVLDKNRRLARTSAFRSSFSSFLLAILSQAQPNLHFQPNRAQNGRTTIAKTAGP